MQIPSDTLARDVVTLAQRLTSPQEPPLLPREQATDALIAMLTVARSSPSHERDSERAALVRSVRESARASQVAN